MKVNTTIKRNIIINQNKNILLIAYHVVLNEFFLNINELFYEKLIRQSNQNFNLLLYYYFYYVFFFFLIYCCCAYHVVCVCLLIAMRASSLV